MKQLEVTILGQSYLLGCPEGGESQLQHAVSTVDHEMSAIRDAGKVKARERMAVLAALNLAYRLADRPAAPPPAPVRSASAAPDDGLDETVVQRLIDRIDGVLDGDGHLL